MSGKAVCKSTRSPQCFRLEFVKWLADLETDSEKDFLGIPMNGATTGYDTDLGNCQDVVHGETKQRVYDNARDFLGNYKTVIGKEDALQKAIGEDLKEGLVSGNFLTLRNGIHTQKPIRTL